MTDSLATGLRCINCGATQPLGYTLQCPKCAGLLELCYDAGALQRRGPSAFTGGGLWRYAPVLPIADPAHRVSLGEGQTPLLECPRLGAQLGVKRLLVKFEGSNPTGTVKDRTSATAVGAALQFGFGATSVVSSGNAGSSIAAYSARAGLRSLIFCYERASAPKMLHMAATASDLVIYKGVYDDLIALWDRLAEERLFFDCGASRNPYKHEGKKTIAYEIAEQMGWRAPDVVVAPAAVGAALQFGFGATSVVSSGNAGSSIAAYSARAGLRSLIFCYERASAPKMLHMAATASDLVIYKGVYDDLIALWDRLAEERLFFDCGASRNPYKHEGKKTIAYEIAEQMGWRAPDVVVAPVAVGETFIAAHRGFAEMERLGFIPKRPLMAAAQAARANAITKAWRDQTAIAPLKIGYTVAEGLAAGNPGRKGDWVLRILRETGGVAGQAEDEEILEAQQMLARTEGIWAGPTGSASLAVLARLLADKQVDPASTICAIVSETGLKTEAPPPSRQGTIFDEESLRGLVRDRLAGC